MLARIPPVVGLLALLSSSSTICRPCEAALKPQLDVELSDYVLFDREGEEQQDMATAATSPSKNNLRGATTAAQQSRKLSTNNDQQQQQQDERKAVESSFFSPDANNNNDNNSNSEIIPSPRIVNGGRANTGRFPYYTSIYTDSWWGPPAHSCGGSLIAPDVVLCAAHCYDPRNPPKSVRVGAYSDNDWSNSNGGQLPFHDSKILDVIIHPRYNTNNLNYDFALFKIEPVRDRELLDSIVKVDVGDRQLESYDSLTAIGLGRIYTDGPLAEYLQEVELKYVANCNRYFRWPGTITNQMMCATDNGEDSCQGDSGGPLFIKGGDFDEDVQVGVVSWGAGGCASGAPGVYSRISSVSSWIKQEVCEISSSPPSDLCPNGGTGGGSNGGAIAIGGGSGSLQPSAPAPAPEPEPPQVCQSCFWIFCWEVAC